MTIGRVGVVVVVAGLLSGAGCRSGPTAIVDRPAYPAGRAVAGTLDIQVIRDEAEIRMTNTTARAIGPSTLWLNRRFSRKIDGLGVGESVQFRLEEFIDASGDRFRGGGFFATERPERLAKAELEPEGDGPVVSLVVVRGEARR